MSARKTYERQAADLEAQIAMLRERRREVLARESEANRKGEDAMAAGQSRSIRRLKPPVQDASTSLGSTDPSCIPVLMRSWVLWWCVPPAC